MPTRLHAATGTRWMRWLRTSGHGIGMGFSRRTEVPCIVVDTGGLVETAGASAIESLMVEQTARAISEADRLIVMVDGRAGITPQDQFVAQLARRSGKPLCLAVNKTEGFDQDMAVADFHQMGLQHRMISAAHMTAGFPLRPACNESDPQDGPRSAASRW